MHEPIYYGPDSATACELILGLREPKELLTRRADQALANHAYMEDGRGTS